MQATSEQLVRAFGTCGIPTLEEYLHPGVATEQIHELAHRRAGGHVHGRGHSIAEGGA